MKKPIGQTAMLLALGGLIAISGCVQPWRPTRLTLPSEHTIVRDQLVIQSDFPLPAQHRLVEELVARRYDLAGSLGLPREGEPIYVYLFEDADQFNAFIRLHYPQFPSRRAFFVQTDTRLQVFAQWGDRVADDLRHEVTHGYLHSLVPNLPLWLDEGLAEYYEAPRGQQGFNREHVENLTARLARDNWHPDPDRLEGLDRPFEMTLDDYAESWAWVHWLLESGEENRRLLAQYLAELRQFGSARPLCMRVRNADGRPDLAVIEHVRRLAAAAR